MIRVRASDGACIVLNTISRRSGTITGVGGTACLTSCSTKCFHIAGIFAYGLAFSNVGWGHANGFLDEHTWVFTGWINGCCCIPVIVHLGETVGNGSWWASVF